MQFLTSLLKSLKLSHTETANDKEENKNGEDMKKAVKWELLKMRQQPKFLEGEKEQNQWNSSFSPSEMVLTARKPSLLSQTIDAPFDVFEESHQFLRAPVLIRA